MNVGMVAADKRAVKKVQALLIIAGCTDDGKIVADGMLGEHTRNAIREFQEGKRIPVTGELDETTLDRMINGFHRADGNVNTIQLIQAAAIIVEVVDDDFVADGTLTDHTVQAAMLISAYDGVMGLEFHLDIPDPRDTEQADDASE